MVVRSALFRSFYRAINALEAIETQTAAHRRKFDFVLLQLKKFYNWYHSQNGEDNVTDEEKDSISKVIDLLKSFVDVLEKFKLETWTNNTIEQPCNLCYENTQEFFQNLAEALANVYPEIDKFFDPNSEDLLRLHTIDLKAIASSFSQYNIESQPSVEIINSLQQRIIEISAKLAEYNATFNLSETDFSPIPKQYSKFKVSIKDFEFQNDIGFGLTGVVYKGINTRTNQIVALKKFTLSNYNTARFQVYQREVSVFARLSEIPHPCIVGFVGATAKPPFCIITEYMPNGSLFEDLTFKHRLDGTLNSIALYDIARGMQYLHANDIIHRDLKSLNILLDEDLHIRICDFGLSRNGSTEEAVKGSTVGTIQWMAPELLTTGKITYKTDVYAFAILLSEMLIGDRPFNQFHDPSKLRRAILDDCARPILPSNTPDSLKKLLEMCWAQNEADRPTFTEIIEKLETLKFYFEGCNLEAFKAHIDYCKANPIYVASDWTKAMDELEANQISFEDLVKKFSKAKLPSAVSERFFQIFSKNMSCNNHEILSTAALFFLNSPSAASVINLLRNLPSKTVNISTIKPFLDKVPTGLKSTDTAIIVTACKNGLIEESFIKATSDNDIMLTLKLLYSGHKLSDSLKSVIADKFVILLHKKSMMLVEAVLRAALVLGLCDRIPHSTYLPLINSGNSILRDICFICAAKQKEFDRRFIHYCVKMWENTYAQYVLYKALENQEIAYLMMVRMELVNNFPIDFCGKALFLIYNKHEDLKQRARRISNNSRFSNASEEIRNLLSSIRN